MFSKSNDKSMTAKTMNKPPRPSNSAPSIIGSDVTIQGNISTVGEIQLEGSIEGDIRSSSLTIGEHGSVQGVVTAEDLVIKGSVKGQIKGLNVRLEKTAKVKGDLFHETLSIEAGAFIEGNLVHKSNAVQDKPAPVSKSPETKVAGLKPT